MVQGHFWDTVFSGHGCALLHLALVALDREARPLPACSRAGAETRRRRHLSRSEKARPLAVVLSDSALC